MTHIIQKQTIYLTLMLVCIIFSDVYASEIDTRDSSPLNQDAGKIEHPPASELLVTLHPLDANSRAENHYRRAITYSQQGAIKAAIEQLTQALSLYHSHILARELLVSLLLSQNSFTPAINVLETGIATVPEHVKFPLWLAQVHLKLNEHQRALNVLEQNEMSFRQTPTYLGALASLYQQNERHNDAHNYYLKAAKLAPQDRRWWLGLGMTAEKLQNWNTAQLAYQRAKENSFIDDPLLPFVQQRLMMMSAQFQE